MNRIAIMVKRFSELSEDAQEAIIAATIHPEADYLPESVKDEVREWAAPDRELVCTCHERDNSYVCQFCYSQGFRGHMQR